MNSVTIHRFLQASGDSSNVTQFISQRGSRCGSYRILGLLWLAIARLFAGSKRYIRVGYTVCYIFIFVLNEREYFIIFHKHSMMFLECDIKSFVPV